MQNYLAHHGIKGQKWGVRRFQNIDGSLTPAGKKRYGEWKPGKKTFRSETKAVIARASNKVKAFEAKPIDEEETAKRGLLDEAENRKCIGLAESIFSKATKEEPKITDDIIDSANKTGSKMYGLDYRLKQPTSLAAKIGADAKEKDLSFEEASKGIKDSVRYTVLSDTDHYTDSYKALKSELLEKGYSEVRFKNYFEKYRNGEVKHKAIQCTYRSPDGFDFEVQFHTPESQAVKELKIPLYEEIRKQGVSTERKERLEKEMQDLAERIPDPPGVYDIKHSDTLDDVLDEFLSHSAKGTVWKDHKYIKKENGRYYYADDKKVSKTSSDELMDEVDAIQQQMAFCDQKAKEYDELAKSNPDEAAEYKAQAKKYRDEIERLNGEREQIAKGLEKKDKHDEIVNDFRNEPLLDTLNKYKKNIYLGNPKLKMKHSDTLDDVLGDYLMHYGVSVDDGAPGPGSGRYPKGSGERPFQHDPEMLAKKKKGLFSGIKTALAKRKANNQIDRYREYAQGLMSSSTVGNDKALREKYKKLVNADYDGYYNDDREKLVAEWKKFDEELIDKHVKAKAKSESLAKAREAKAAKEAREAEKAKAIASGDPEQISKWLSEMTDEEQYNAINRIRQTQDIKNQAAAQVKAREDAARAEEQRIAQQKAAEEARKRAIEEANRPKTKQEIRKEKFENFMDSSQQVLDRAKQIRDMAEKGIDIWNTIAALNNTFNEDHEMKMIKRPEQFFKEKADKEAAKIRREQQLEDAKTKRENDLADALRKEQREDEKWRKEFINKNGVDPDDITLKNKETFESKEPESKSSEPKKEEKKSGLFDKFKKKDQSKAESKSETESEASRQTRNETEDWYDAPQSISRKLLTSSSEARKEAAETGDNYWKSIRDWANDPSTERESNAAYNRDRANENARYNEWEANEQKNAAQRIANEERERREAAERHESESASREARLKREAQQYKFAQTAYEEKIKARDLDREHNNGDNWRHHDEQVKEAREKLDEISKDYNLFRKYL